MGPQGCRGWLRCELADIREVTTCPGAGAGRSTCGRVDGAPGWGHGAPEWTHPRRSEQVRCHRDREGAAAGVGRGGGNDGGPV